MPIDTRDRRVSAVLVGLPWRGLLPAPDVGAEDQGDRQQVAFHYRGILAASAAVLPTARVTAAVLLTPRTGVRLLSPARQTVVLLTARTGVELLP